MGKTQDHRNSIELWLTVGGGWQSAVGGWWWLAVGAGWSLGAVLNRKKLEAYVDSPGVGIEEAVDGQRGAQSGHCSVRLVSCFRSGLPPSGSLFRETQVAL